MIDKTYIVQKDENIAPSFDPNLSRSLPSPIPVDTSTVINETRHEQSKKSDGSSIQIHLQTREETSDLSISTSNPTLDSDDRHKFQSFVLTMTALKEKQKVKQKFLSMLFLLYFCFRLNFIDLLNFSRFDIRV